MILSEAIGQAIRRVWNIIKEKVKTKNPKSQCDLKNPINEACHNLSFEVLQIYVFQIDFLTDVLYQQTCIFEYIRKRFFLIVVSIF